jgi:hypothetical protein
MTPDAIERLYSAFAEVPRPSRVEGCPCCVGPGEEAPFLGRPLRTLTADELSRYGAKALTSSPT